SKDQAEGAHLRMLYPSGGSQDGTAEEHLDHARERGEYTGEGERVRTDGSTFWAGVTLTALRDQDGELLGFAKVTRDLTARRAADHDRRRRWWLRGRTRRDGRRAARAADPRQPARERDQVHGTARRRSGPGHCECGRREGADRRRPRDG